MSKKDDFGKRMKRYEQSGTNQILLPDVPVVARIDGRAFHGFCKRNFEAPYDVEFNNAMIATAEYLVKETHALIAYTQSDEITLIYDNSYRTPMLFDGKIFKLTSVLASLATVAFNSAMPDRVTEPATFDCRVYTVPDKEEACNALLWREKDATRNSIFSLARTFYSHKELNNKSSSDLQEMIFQKGINWNDCPTHQKRGTYVRIETLPNGKFPPEVIEQLPEKHQARANPDLVVTRKQMTHVDMPPFGTVVNKVEVVFSGAQPNNTLGLDNDGSEVTTGCGDECGCNDK